jgi:alanine dehydrogenase
MSALQKIAATDAATQGLRCSFWGKRPADDSDLVAGPKVYICDECVATCNDMLSAEDNGHDDDPDESSDVDGEETTLRGAEPPVKRRYFRLLTEGDVAGLLTADDLDDAMAEALRRVSSGDVVQPLRTVLPIGSGEDVLAVMPAFLPEPAVLGAKLVTVFGRNTALDLPTHLASVLLFSAETGALLAVLAGSYITEMRTAAVSALSADLLARDDAAVLAIVGSGAQARSHLQALERVFELSETRVWSPTADHQLAFIDEMRPRTHARLVGTDSAEQAVSNADLVVLATSSRVPVVQSEWIKAGAHVISVGACRPDQREMDPALVKRGRLFVDSRAVAMAESGDIVMGIQEHHFTPSHIVGELGELLGGKIEGRRSLRDVTIFKSLGMAIEDVVAADLAFRRAVVKEVGQELEL